MVEAVRCAKIEGKKSAIVTNTKFLHVCALLYTIRTAIEKGSKIDLGWERQRVLSIASRVDISSRTVDMGEEHR